MATPTRWANYPEAGSALDGPAMAAMQRAKGANLARNPYMRAWRGDRPLYWGVRNGTPTVAPAKDTSTGQGWRGDAALDWTVDPADGVLQLVQDLGGVLAPTLEGASVMGGWAGLTVVVRCRTSAASMARPYIRHSGVDYQGDWHTGGGALEDLAVTLPGSVAVAEGDTVYAGLEFGTSGSTQHVYVDHVQVTPGEWQPGVAVAQDARVLAEIGEVQSSWSRRSESGGLLVLTPDFDGTIRSGQVHVDYLPDWTAMLGATPRVVAGLATLHDAGTNAWTAAQLRKAMMLDWGVTTAGQLSVRCQQGQTFGTAGTSLRASLLWVLEPEGEVDPWSS